MERQSSLASLANREHTKLGSCMLLCGDYFYDTLSGLISLLDVITDIIILIYYYQTHKQVFFYLSLSILLFAQLSYAILFVIRFGSHLKIRHKVLTFIIILPICPFMCYIFYWASLPNNRLSKVLAYLGLQCSEYEPPSEKQCEKLGITKLQEYFAEKLMNHTGFVLEAIFESFPMSVLQCVAMIIYYNSSSYYYNVLTFASILISLISISAKSLMFSASLNIATFFFNWLCAICDFFTLYLIFVWVFFVPDIVHPLNNGNGHDYSLSLFATIWMYKFVICTVTPIVVGTFILSIFIAIDLYDDITLDMYRENCCEYIYKLCIIIGITIVVAIVWSFGVVLLIIFGEILCCTWVAIGFYYYNESRFSHSRTFMKIFYWLYLSTDSTDLLIRLISINYRLSHGKMMNDVPLHKFLTNVIKNDLTFNTVVTEPIKKGNDKIVKTVCSDKDPELFDTVPIPSDVCTTNMLFESADDYDKQQKQLSDYFSGEYEDDFAVNHRFNKDFGTSLLNDDLNSFNNPHSLLYYDKRSLKDITYKDLRVRCKNKHKTHLISVILKQMIKPINDDKLRISELNQQLSYVYGHGYINALEIRVAKLITYIQLFADYILWFFFVPLYAVSRVFNLLIPIIGLILTPQMRYITFFQWILTALFFILCLGLCVLFPSVWKFQFLAWHVSPGYSIISPKIHTNANIINELHTKTDTEAQYICDGNNSVNVSERTTTLEEILSDRSSAQNSSISDTNEVSESDTIECEAETETETETVTNNKNKRNAGPRRQRRIRRKHARQARKQKKKKLKRIREKIRKYEKLEFYEWVKEFYFKCVSIPLIRQMIIDRFGTDIGSVILCYMPCIIDETDNVVMKEVEADVEDCDDEYGYTDGDYDCESSYNDPLKDYYSNNRDEMDEIDEKNMINIMDFYSESQGNTNFNGSNCTKSTKSSRSNSNMDERAAAEEYFAENINENNVQLMFAGNNNSQSLLGTYDDLQSNCNTVNLNDLYTQ